MHIHKNTVWLGLVLGIIVPFIGVFAGLQISATLGNILAFPLVAVAYASGVPFGEWGIMLFLTAAIFSIGIWTGIVHLVTKLSHTKK